MATNKFEQIKEIIADAEVDADKFFKNRNGAAGARLREKYKTIITLAKEGRFEVSAIKNQSKDEPA